jgi:GTP-binding protein LepA
MRSGSVRNFSIIAHIDHGKSTLADRMLELTGTVEKRKMREQVLDSMELERERGITIKMQPVRMQHVVSGQSYTLNLIDTPGHIDFAYEVSRALSAVEGAVLLVDATQGVQAQTLSVLSTAKQLGLVVIPAVSKVDASLARVSEVKADVAKLLGCELHDVIETSGKTGHGVVELLNRVVSDIPTPRPKLADGKEAFRALIFDFEYSDHRGVIVYTRVADGSVSKGTQLTFRAARGTFSALEVGIFTPEMRSAEMLSMGEIGYIVTGIKEPGIASVGDTIIVSKSNAPALPGYQEPRPVVWASMYPESQDDLSSLRQALGKLRLTDASLSYEEESSGALGRGFRCGFLGMLHLEIVTERLRREFNLSLVVTTPSIAYEVEDKSKRTEMVYTPSRFPAHGDVVSVREPWAILKIIVPQEHMGALVQLLADHEAELGESETFGDGRTMLSASMPLRELMRGFFDRMKNATSGYASLTYEIGEMRNADVVRLDVMVAEELVPAFSRIVSRRRVEQEARNAVERLYDLLPRQQFATKIQSTALGRIIASKTLPALRKDVTGYLYGGDITRKRKLWEKQKKGNKRLQARGKVNIPQEVFLKMMRGD